jgi:hypothetical protein
MATLTNTKIKDTYKSLLKVSDNGNLEAGLQEITDGEGNASGVQLNTGWRFDCFRYRCFWVLKRFRGKHYHYQACR